jgi:hypothetical protein
MESVLHDVDRAMRHGHNSLIKLVLWKGFVVRQACREQSVWPSTSSGRTER